MQLKNTQTSVDIETQLLDVYRSGLMVAERCIRLPRTLTVNSVQVYDWMEDGERGEVALPSTLIDSIYAPCEWLRHACYKICMHAVDIVIVGSIS